MSDSDELDSKKDSAVEETKKSKKKRVKAPKGKALVVLLIVALIGVAGFMTFKYMDLKQNPNKVTEAEQKSLIQKVGKLMKLPDGEQPSIATVSDKEKLKDQAFFSKAENGDTLLIYTTAKQAILYREKDNQIIQVAPIAIDTTTGGTTQGTTPAPAPEQKTE